MTDNLRAKALSGLFWSSSERFGQQGIQFVISIILARLLLPEEFGLVAMLAFFMAVAGTFIDSGFGAALIRDQDAKHIDECSIFYFNLMLSIVLALMLCLAAPLIAGFYERPILTSLTRVMSLNLVINAFGLIQTTLLTKQINFKTQMKVGMIATVSSGMIGIALAYRGFGVWSLVAQLICRTAIRSALLWALHAWRPAYLFSFSSLARMFPFGSKLLLSSLLDTSFNNLYLLVIGKIYSAFDLGFYTRAHTIQQLPASNIASTVSRVTYPLFTAVQDDKVRLKRGLSKALKTMSVFSFPLMIGLAAIAEPLVLVLLTEKWLQSVPYLQLLCFGGMFYPLSAVNLNALKAQGRSELVLRLEILKKLLTVAAIAITYRWGISAMIGGGVVTSCVSYYINSYYTSQLLNYSFVQQLRDVMPCFVLAIIMGTAISALGLAAFSNHWTLLTAQVSLGVLLYCSLCRALRLSAFMELIAMLRIQFLTKVASR